MDCQQSLELLHGYLDGELDAVHSVEMESHLQSCGACRNAYEQQQTLRRVISGASCYRAPTALREKVRSELRRVDPPRLAWQQTPLRLIAIAAAMVMLVPAIWLLDRNWRRNAAVDQVVDSHVRSLLVDHLVDVASSDRHEVKPWFNGKLDYAPAVSDLASQGFPLIGGRLDFVNHRPVAVLVYGRRKHVINLFCWPTTDMDHVKLQQLERSGFHLVHWTQGSLEYWALSDLNAAELAQFANLVQGVSTEPSEN